MTTGVLFVHVTAWLAFAAYVGGSLIGLRTPASLRFRCVWLTGALLLLVHLLAAFHFIHGWSHAAAYADTARQTREVTGLDWGGGVYFNYALASLWLADAGIQLAAPGRLPRPARVALAGFYAFMWFNAAVVFVHNPVRWVGAAAFAWLAWRKWHPTSGGPAHR